MEHPLAAEFPDRSQMLNLRNWGPRPAGPFFVDAGRGIVDAGAILPFQVLYVARECELCARQIFCI
jgi:hypothetical protein